MTAFNFYPEQLRQIAAMCDALDKADSAFSGEGMSLMLAQGIEVWTEDGVVVGHLRDEVGGAWSFTACELYERDPVVQT